MQLLLILYYVKFHEWSYSFLPKKTYLLSKSIYTFNMIYIVFLFFNKYSLRSELYNLNTHNETRE